MVSDFHIDLRHIPFLSLSFPFLSSSPAAAGHGSSDLEPSTENFSILKIWKYALADNRNPPVASHGSRSASVGGNPIPLTSHSDNLGVIAASKNIKNYGKCKHIYK